MDGATARRPHGEAVLLREQLSASLRRILSVSILSENAKKAAIVRAGMRGAFVDQRSGETAIRYLQGRHQLEEAEELAIMIDLEFHNMASLFHRRFITSEIAGRLHYVVSMRKQRDQSENARDQALAIAIEHAAEDDSDRNRDSVKVLLLDKMRTLEKSGRFGEAAEFAERLGRTQYAAALRDMEGIFLEELEACRRISPD